jgi:hypothetical protein
MLKLKVAIATPYYNFVPVAFHLAMINLVHEFHKQGWDLNLYSVDRTNCVHARNQLMRAFIWDHCKVGFDYIFHIDSDTIFAPQDFFTLIRDAVESKVQILSGLYYQRHNAKDGQRFPIVLRKKIDGRYTYEGVELKEKINEVDAVGFGFMVCTPEIYLHIARDYGRFVFDYVKVGEDMLSEDIVWCERAHKLGYNTYVDRDVVVGHYGVI